ncbi:Snapalysin [Kribbella flavida DSM 17836]|uniref:Extracellular small neutral protease n=1 Tax=Kribbella flavida (strain DSM 17836 / JCM 10339 / NBRC 14399) TaxID=479435 RepID=D2PN31_KRIFD|nr:snapalysin [Kribbella flavida]ADB34515.1 Snapalysin [Kribbella flavida DSM 17836]
MPNRILSSLAGLAAAALSASLFAAAPAAAAPAPERVQAATTTVSAYAGSPQEALNNKAFYDAVMKSALAKQAKAGNRLAAVTVRYRVNAPTFATQISRSTQIWNSSVTNVRLVQSTSGYDFYYTEGNDPRGSYASTNGHGRGYIFLDYAQSRVYNPLRITAHETGHVLGLPDHYSGPCSELMSGGGPGPSCTNAYPNSAERSRVNQLWANGFTGLSGTFKTIR